MPEPPDIEIYLKRVETADIVTWLKTHFDVTDEQAQGRSLQLSLSFDGRPVTCMLVEGAARGGYTSVWFKENITPWTDDAACAAEAFAHFGQEVRYVNGSWNNHDEGGWIRLNKDGESIVNWKT